MRKIAYVSLSSLAIAAAMTSQAWASSHHLLKHLPNAGALTPNVGALTPNVGALTPNVGALTPNVGALSPNVGALTPPTHINPPNVPGGNYGQLPNPAKVPIYDAANAPLGGFDAPTLNSGNLAPEAPRLNYGSLQPEAPNARMGQLPPAYDVVPNNPGAVVNYEVLPPNQAAALPNRPQLNYGPLQPEAPNAPFGKLPDRPLPLAYGELPSPPRAQPNGPNYTTLPPERPAEELARLVEIPIDHPGVANALDNTITHNVGVPNPPVRTPVANVRPLPNVQSLPPPRSLAAAPPPPAPPKSYWQKLSTKQKRVIVGTGAVVGTTIALTAVGIAMPTIIEAATGKDVATGDTDVDKVINALTPNQSQN